MKRKIVNGFLLMAFFVSSVSMFVACKDYDEDVYVDLKSQLAKEKTLRELLQQQVDELEAFAKSIEQCKCNLEAELAEYLKKSEADKTYLKKDELEGYLQTVANMQASIQILQEALDKINATLDGVVTRDEFNQLIEQNETILHLQELVEEALELAKAAQGCNCNFDEMFAGINGRLDALEALAAGMPDQIAAILEIATQALDKATANAALIDAQNQTIEDLKKLIEDLQNQVDNLPSGGSCTCGNPNSCSCNLKAITDRLSTLEQQLNNKATKDELTALKTELEGKITEAKNIANQAKTKAEEALAAANAAQSTANANSGRLDLLETKVGTLQSTLTNLVTDVDGLKTDVGTLQTDVNNLSGKVTELEGKVNKLVADIAKLISDIIVQAAESPVVGYLNTPLGLNSTILAVYYGEPLQDWEFPSTIPENYVNKDDDFNKWTLRNFAAIESSLSNVPGSVHGSANKNIVTGIDAEGNATPGNAGTLYLTVNPAEADFTDLKLELVDSKDEEAPATLSPLKRSDRQLTFGFTRSANNAFYEAKATIEAEKVEKAKMNIDYRAIADDAKRLLQDRTKSDVLELGATLLKNAGDVLPAYGTKASWLEENSSIGKRTIYSQYNIAATAVQPLSFSFLHDWKGINSMPGLDRLQNLVGQIVNKIKINLNLNLPDFTKYADVEIEFGNIEMPEVGDKFKIEFRLKLTNDKGEMFVPVVYPSNGQLLLLQIMRDENDGYYVYKVYAQNNSGSYVEVNKDDYEFGNLDDILNEFLVREIDLTEDMKSTLEDIIKNINESINGSGINDTLKDLFNDIAAIGDLDGQISGAIEDAKNDIKSTINSYISRINNKLTKWINRAPGLLHLTMVANSGNKLGLLSQSKYMPTKVSGTVTLIPTTYNLELLAPAYKKFVAVTDVFNADGTDADINKAKAANKGGDSMNMVIEGNTTCEFTGESGYIYEVTYTAIDYFGMVAIRKYYVKF